MVAIVFIQIHHSLHIYQLASVRKSLPFFPIYLLTYYLSVFIHSFWFLSLCYNPLCFLILDAEIIPDEYDRSSPGPSVLLTWLYYYYYYYDFKHFLKIRCSRLTFPVPDLDSLIFHWLWFLSCGVTFRNEHLGFRYAHYSWSDIASCIFNRHKTCVFLLIAPTPIQPHKFLHCLPSSQIPFPHSENLGFYKHHHICSFVSPSVHTKDFQNV